MTINDIARPQQLRCVPRRVAARPVRRRRLPARRPRFRRGPDPVERRGRPAAGAVAYPANAQETAEVVRAAVEAGLRVAPQSTGHNAGPLGRLDDVVIVRTSGDDARSRSTRCGRSPGSAAAHSGCRWWRPLPRRVSPCCTAPRRTSASPATRWAAASSLYAASSACRPTTSPACRSSPPTARSCGPTPPRTRSCSGPFAAAAATSASSPRWNSRSSRSRRSTRGCWSGTAPKPSGCCAAGSNGPRTPPTRSPPPSGC